MKDLRTLLEASILDIEDAVNKEFDFKTLVNSKTQREFLETDSLSRRGLFRILFHVLTRTLLHEKRQTLGRHED